MLNVATRCLVVAIKLQTGRAGILRMGCVVLQLVRCQRQLRSRKQDQRKPPHSGNTGSS